MSHKKARARGSRKLSSTHVSVGKYLPKSVYKQRREQIATSFLRPIIGCANIPPLVILLCAKYCRLKWNVAKMSRRVLLKDDNSVKFLDNEARTVFVDGAVRRGRHKWSFIILDRVGHRNGYEFNIGICDVTATNDSDTTELLFDADKYTERKRTEQEKNSRRRGHFGWSTQTHSVSVGNAFSIVFDADACTLQWIPNEMNAHVAQQLPHRWIPWDIVVEVPRAQYRAAISVWNAKGLVIQLV